MVIQALKRMFMKWLILILMLTLSVSCTMKNTNTPTTMSIQVALDWTPNTNHTGLYVAQSLGYFEEEGLAVDIISPNDNGAEAMVATGTVDFGVSYQEGVTLARTQGVPIVSIAAVIQHNTSGFASPINKKIVTPKDFEGKVYGGWGSPMELAMIKSVMRVYGADESKVEIVNIGQADFFTAVKRDIDFSWIYYGWTGVDAQLRNEPINMIYLKDISDELDYFTPVIITNEKNINDNPRLVKSFLNAVSRGYIYAIKNPNEAAEILIKAAPELDPELVRASQKWLSPRYQDDAQKWGIQNQKLWDNYSSWLIKNELLDASFNAQSAYTNDFLP